MKMMHVSQLCGRASDTTTNGKYGYLFVSGSWFEMGTSFSLPAMGALATRMKFRFDLTETQLGSLVQSSVLTVLPHSAQVVDSAAYIAVWNRLWVWHSAHVCARG